MPVGLSEDDISVKFITPALHRAGWDEDTQIRRQVSFTKGRIIVRGKLVARGKPKRADFVLYHQHIAIALIEAKTAHVDAGHGMQQALDYAQTLEAPFVFSSTGHGLAFHDRTGQSAQLECSLGLTSRGLMPMTPPVFQYESYARAFHGILIVAGICPTIDSFKNTCATWNYLTNWEIRIDLDSRPQG